MRRPGSWVAWPAVALTLLLATDCSSAEFLAQGICSSIDIRNSPETMINKLSGCQVIEGYLSIVLMERVSQPNLNISFPELREVTDYILIYRFVKGVRNLGDLFPNLAVIRGMHLLKDYALVIFDSAGIESLGLRSLTRIERGAVRIQHNDRLCYANTIDWNRITQGNDNNIIRSNYDTRLCGLCPNAQSRMEDRGQLHLQCPADSSGRLLCWDDKHCQKQCPSACGNRACMDNGTCCHASCLGGCDGTGPTDCHVCANFSLQYGKQRTCVEHCPANTYELARRCVTEQECRQTPPPQLPAAAERRGLAPKIKAYKILDNRMCVYTCPSGYTEEGDAAHSVCKPCPSSVCVRECGSTKIDSVAAAESYRGCTRVKGDLEITLRPQGGNTMATLEASLGEIREIGGCLKVTRSYPLVSLMFLKNLERIGGKCDDNKTQSLYIFNNPNLEMLWDWSKKSLVVETGKLFIHFNPKLCYSQIEPLKNMTKESTFSEIEVSADNNGDQASCLQEVIDFWIQDFHRNLVIISWNRYCLSDPRKLLGYSVYFLPTENNVTIYGQRDACSDNWNVIDITQDKLQNNSKSDEAKADAILNPVDKLQNNSKSDEAKAGAILNRVDCKKMQPHFYPLGPLTPYTRYAAYIKTYTTLQDKKGAQSAIIYFRTLPGQPSPPLSVTAEAVSAHAATVRWEPPAEPNGTVISYRIELQANAYNRPKILAGNVNYCGNPSALLNMIAVRSDEGSEGRAEGEGESGEGGEGAGRNDTCDCSRKPVERFSVRAEEERQESINFENDLQNLVYIRNKAKSGKVRRSIDSHVKSMLVILSESSKPMPNATYSNSTDGAYVKSLYYNLDASARSLTVENMRHFTWYTVSIWACRAKQDKEKMKDYIDTWCSERAYYTFRTLEKINADVVRNVDAKVLPSNKTFPEVNVTWQPPEDPNGFVLAYNVHYSRVETHSQDIGLQSCITADDYEHNGRSYVLRNLAPGNYSVKVTPVTLSGAGNVSANLFVLIPERGHGYAWVWGVVGGCAVLLGVAGAAGWYARRALLPAHDANKLFARVNPEYVSTVYVPDEWEVPRTSIEFIRELGQGSFGMVYEGIAKNIEKGKPETRCAVKTVNEHATDRERIEFLNEASVMKAFDTFHVVRLLGVVSRGQPTLVVMELMECGDLKSYLRSHRPDADGSLPKRDDKPEPPTLQSILQMAIEIADGMAYLSAKKFVHRDLAARNCMVAGDLTVKVGDFGMTRDIYETDYYRKGTKGLLPVRWMSPESLKDGVFSSNSDVWSYGVVLWEMATLAMQPYQGLSNEQVVRYVVEGGVMERPEHCPDRLYELMRACWSHRASARPSFLRLVADLAPSAMPYFRHRSFFHSPQGQEMYALQHAAMVEEQERQEANVGAVATGSGSNLFGVSGRLASWVRELSSLRSRDDDAAAEPLQPAAPAPPPPPAPAPLARKAPPNGVLRDRAASTRC